MSLAYASEPAADPVIVAVSQATGWWVITTRERPDGSIAYRRSRVAAWGTTEDGVVIALVPSTLTRDKGYVLRPPVEHIDRLAADESFDGCDCAQPRIDYIGGDETFCVDCAGVLER